MMPWYLGNNRMDFSHWWGFPGVVVPLALWSVIWTGLALWHAAKRQEKWWFILFLFVHTAGIIEILYLVFAAKAFATPKSSRKKRR